MVRPLPCQAQEAADTAAPPALKLHITDFGINQWFPELRSGMGFGSVFTRKGWKQLNAVYPELCPAGRSPCPAQILLVMPDDEEYRAKGFERMEDGLAAVLEERVAAAIEAGYTELEIQLIQNINTPGYFVGGWIGSRQGLVTMWGSAAYRAIGRLHDKLTAARGGAEDSVVVDAAVGSNGVAVFARNHTIWMTYLDRADFFDGRASMQEALDAIDALARHTGRNDRLRIFNIHGDWWGGGLYLGGPYPSISNLDVSDAIKRIRSGTRVFLLTPRSRSAPAHVAAMSSKDYGQAFFRVEERFLEPGTNRVVRGEPREVQFRQLHDGSTPEDWPEAAGTGRRGGGSGSSASSQSCAFGSPEDCPPTALPVCPDGFAPPCSTTLWDTADRPLLLLCPDGSVPPCVEPLQEDRFGECDEGSGDSCPPRSSSIPNPPPGGVLLRTDLVKDRARELEKGLGRREIVAVSMREIERAHEASARPEDFAKARPDLYYLGGITWPWAVVIDSGSGDWILVGERDPAHSVLSLDDWAAAIRSRSLFPAVDPGVTLLPSLEGCAPSLLLECFLHPHRVHFFAGIENTEFGATCLEADVLLKRIVLGLESPPPALRLRSLPSLLTQEKDDNRFSLVFNRFWIYPLSSEVNIADDVALLERYQLGVLTEVLDKRDQEGREIDVSSSLDPMADRIARSLSDAFPVLAQRWPVLDRLQGLGRLASLAKGLQALRSGRKAQTFLAAYLPRSVPTAEEVDVHRVPVSPVLAVSGGVQLDVLLAQLAEGDLRAFRELVLASRPGKEAGAWEFTATVEDGRFTALRYALPGTDASRAAPLLQQAGLLAARGYYEPSLQLYDRVLEEFPDYEAARRGRALALFKSGRRADAFREADSAVSIRGSEEALLMRARLRAENGQSRAALSDLDRAIELNPSAMAFLLRAMIHLQQSLVRDAAAERQCALADLDRVLERLPEDPLATLYRGFVLLSGAMNGKNPALLSAALVNFTKVAGVRALRPKALLGRGVARVLAKQYKEALADLDEALEVFPEDSVAHLARAEAREALRQYPGAAMDRRKALRGGPTIFSSIDGMANLLDRW